MMSNWDWSDKSDLVIEPVRAIAVYENQAGQIVIRQEGINGEQDSIIVFPARYGETMANAIIAESNKAIEAEDNM